MRAKVCNRIDRLVRELQKPKVREGARVSLKESAYHGYEEQFPYVLAMDMVVVAVGGKFLLAEMAGGRRLHLKAKEVRVLS